MGEDSKAVVGLVVPTTLVEPLEFEELLRAEHRAAALFDSSEPINSTQARPPRVFALGEPLPDTDERTIESGNKVYQLRKSGPGKGRRAESVHLLTIAIQALQTAREAALKVRGDMPPHERQRLLIPAVSDAGLAIRSVQEALERWERGGL